MALMSEKELAVAIAVPDKVMHVELADKESFQEAYLGSIAFTCNT